MASSARFDKGARKRTGIAFDGPRNSFWSFSGVRNFINKLLVILTGTQTDAYVCSSAGRKVEQGGNKTNVHYSMDGTLLK